MRLTSKGQVTVPKPVRDKLGLGPGSEVEFVLDGDTARLVPLAVNETGAPKTFQEWAQSVAGKISLAGLTTDAFMIDLRGVRDDVDAG